MRRNHKRNSPKHQVHVISPDMSAWGVSCATESVLFMALPGEDRRRSQVGVKHEPGPPPATRFVRGSPTASIDIITCRLPRNLDFRGFNPRC
jgi:hypothetical protein